MCNTLCQSNFIWLTQCIVQQLHWSSRGGQTNLWHAARFPWHTTFTAVTIYLHFFCPTSVSILWRTSVYTHTSDCVQTAHELPLLPNNTAVKRYLHKLWAVRSVHWVFIIGAPAWRWLGKYVTVDKTFYSLTFKQEVITAPITSAFSCLSHSSRKPLLKV